MSYFNTSFIISLISSLVVSVTFAIIFRTKPRHLPYAGVCGMITYLIYYTCDFFGMPLFVSAFLSTMFTGIFAETAARILRAPALIYILAGVIPTVPGASLYYTMRDVISEKFATAVDHLTAAIEVGLGIAGGIVAVSLVYRLALDLISSVKKRRTQEKK